LIVGQAEPVVDALFTELRILRTTREEPLEGRAQLDDGHLRRALGDFQNPRELLAFDAVECAAQRHL
jgi:hypothetical protein